MFFVVFSALVLALFVLFVVFSQVVSFKTTRLQRYIETRDPTVLSKKFVKRVKKSLDDVNSTEHLEGIIENAEKFYEFQRWFGLERTNYWEQEALTESLLKAQFAWEKLNQM